ncbi:Alpha/Beta hydrolase protein [Diplogelasinospora grovesii]|uniref:Alpha/Beta hydrolase protein n=1 Tax=Diplogelasinospora grovesii TaxID=303347 RepID=A0AAN6N4Z8_9PEZI|nr:Alpha/Beta hydrolase protein [Diplogelasinospora grovesii]
MKLSSSLLLLSSLSLSTAALIPSRSPFRTLAKRANATVDPMYQLSNDSDFHFELLRVLSMAPYEGSDIGETLVAAKQIIPGSYESFYSAFFTLANRVLNVSTSIDATRFPVSARNAWFKTSSYFRSADFFLHGNWSDPRINSLWDSQLSAFDAALSLMPKPIRGERITLHSANTTNSTAFSIPAVFYPSGKPGPRPTIILCNGYDGSQEEMYHFWVKAIVERGMNAITYEGPGQPTVRRQQNLGFIPNWEAVVTPVVDYALTRREVSPSQIGILGFSFGGYLAPRAAAFEHRLAAVLAIDGEYNTGPAILSQFPAALQAAFNASDADAFNKGTEDILSSPEAPTEVKWAIQQGMWAFKEASPYNWMKNLQAYTLVGITDKIQAPVFVADAENDIFFPGQGKILAEHLGDLATYHYFTGAEGAGAHCSLGAEVLQTQVALDWFEETVKYTEKQGCS